MKRIKLHAVCIRVAEWMIQWPFLWDSDYRSKLQDM